MSGYEIYTPEGRISFEKIFYLKLSDAEQKDRDMIFTQTSERFGNYGLILAAGSFMPNGLPH